MLKEPLSNPDAQKLIRECVAAGRVIFGGHSLNELAADNFTTEDALRCLRSGYVEGKDLIRGTWRYRVRTPQVIVVVAFRDRSDGVRVAVVTAFKA